MTPLQSFALSHLLKDPTDPESLKNFAKTIFIDTEQFGAILVVGRFEGELSWHVSVSALTDHFKPIQWQDLRPSQREAVRELARELLRDVGRPDSDLDAADGATYQIIRKLTIEEERLTT